MQYENLLISTENGIMTVTINRPAHLNALNNGVIMELDHLFDRELPVQTGITGVIITGSGEKAFVAGADIKEFLGLEGDAAKHLAERGQRIFFAIERSSIPVIAAVNGFALGGGCELAMACHLRIAGTKAKFGQPEVNLGLIPGYGGTQRLTQLVGKGKALELMLTADLIDATEAHRLGLVNHVVEAGTEVAAATALLQKIASKAPIAITGVIASVNAYFDNPNTGYATEIEHFTRAAATDDFREGATAFVEKRKATFSGK